MRIRDLKAEAREQLLGHYGFLFLGLVIYKLILAAVSGMIVFGIFTAIDNGIQLAGDGSGAGIIGGVVIAALFILIRLALGFVFDFGYLRLERNIARNTAYGISDIFSAFTPGSGFWTYVGAFLLKSVFIAIPGIVAGVVSGVVRLIFAAAPGESSAALLYTCSAIETAGTFVSIWLMIKYFFVEYLAVDRSGIDVMDCLRLSDMLTKGRRCKLFLLSMSFILWIILDLFSLGLLEIWFDPYVNFTGFAAYREAAGELQAAAGSLAPAEDILPQDPAMAAENSTDNAPAGAASAEEVQTDAPGFEPAADAASFGASAQEVSYPTFCAAVSEVPAESTLPAEAADDAADAGDAEAADPGTDVPSANDGTIS